MNIAILLKSSHLVSLIHTAAARASWKQVVGFVFENRGTNGASDAVTQGIFLTSLTKPFVNYPKRKNRRKENDQVDKDQCRQLHPDHGTAPPQCHVTGPQVRSGAVLNLTVRIKSSAFWSSALLPLDRNKKR